MRRCYVSKFGYCSIEADIDGDKTTIFGTNCFGENPFQVETKTFKERFVVPEEQDND